MSYEPEFRAGLMPGQAARRGAVLELYGPADGLYLDELDLTPVLGASGTFTAPASGSPLYHTTELPVVQVGGWRARVLFSGLAPGQLGVWQINILIPEDAAGGLAPIQISYDGYRFRTFDVALR